VSGSPNACRRWRARIDRDLMPRSARTGGTLRTWHHVGMRSALLIAGVATALAACNRSEPARERPAEATHARGPAPSAGHDPRGADCATLTGDNPVQTEMRQLECALQRAVVAIGRDELASIAHDLHVVHAAREETERALAGGAWQPARGHVEGFVALDEAFHRELESLVRAARAGDHGGSASALGRALAACQGCHAAYRAEVAVPPPAPAAAHEH
jgi:hypothetical protein